MPPFFSQCLAALSDHWGATFFTILPSDVAGPPSLSWVDGPSSSEVASFLLESSNVVSPFPLHRRMSPSSMRLLVGLHLLGTSPSLPEDVLAGLEPFRRRMEPHVAELDAPLSVYMRREAVFLLYWPTHCVSELEPQLSDCTALGTGSLIEQIRQRVLVDFESRSIAAGVSLAGLDRLDASSVECFAALAADEHIESLEEALVFAATGAWDAALALAAPSPRL